MEDYWVSWVEQTLLSKIAISIGIVLVVLILSRFIKRAISRYVNNTDARYRLRKFTTFSRYILIILFLSLIFNDRLGNLTVAIGVIGAGVAFALQEVIASYAGWFAINFAGFYKSGDRVQLGGIKGDVIDISLLRTTLMEVGEWVNADLYSGRVVRVANSFVLKQPVFNYSGEFPFLWDEIIIPVKYGSDHHLARTILDNTARELVGNYSTESHISWIEFSKQFLLEDATVEPKVTMMLNDNWIEFTLRYVVDYKVRRSTKDKLFTKILDEFVKNGDRVKIASTTLQLVDTPVFEVATTNLKSKE